MIEFGAELWTHALCNDYSRGTVPIITITEVRWGMHVDRPARTVWHLHTALDIHPDLSGKACVCRAGLGCTKLNSLLNFLVGSSQQQLSSMLKKFILKSRFIQWSAAHVFWINVSPSSFPVEIRAAIFPDLFQIKTLAPLSEIPIFNWLRFLQRNHLWLLALFLI